MAEVTLCDRCGRRLQARDAAEWRRVEVHSLGERERASRPPDMHDLCGRCYALVADALRKPRRRVQGRRLRAIE